MKISKIKLKNYRNYDELEVKLNDKLNIFIGDNAQGKSNLLESIYVLAVTKSYLSIKDKDLIEYNKEFASIEGDVVFDNYSIDSKFNVAITSKEKKVKVNNVEIKKYSDYISKLCVIIFSPDNVGMIKDSPGVRRNYLNVEISQINNVYLKQLQSYNFILKQRNEYFKHSKEIGKYDLNYLNILNSKMAEFAVSIIKNRFNYVNLINSFIDNIFYELTNIKGLNLKYLPSIDMFEEKNKMLNLFLKKLDSLFESEKLNCCSLFGPHREDFKFYLNNKDMTLFASQGQLRMAVLSLKLAEVKIFKLNTKENPILLLDDIFSELDLNKKNRLIKYILNDVQTIVTTTDLNMLDESLINKANIYIVRDGTIVDFKEGEL